MMELKDFIEQSVSDITDAIQDLKRRYNLKNTQYDAGAYEFNPIAPEYDRLNCTQEKRCIEFDIAVTTSENGTAKAGSKIGISVLGANVNGERGYNNENTSRIKFSIPFYPEYIDKNQK